MMRHWIVLIILIPWFTACVQGSAAGKRSSITNFAKQKQNQGDGCGTDYLDLVTDSQQCVKSCDELTDAHAATTDEMIKLKTDYKDHEDVLKLIQGSRGVCIADEITKMKYNQQFAINSNFCSCINGKPDIINDCEATCAAKPVTASPTLYASVTMGAAIAGHPELGTLSNFCTRKLTGDQTQGTVKCVLEAKDINGDLQTFDIDLVANSNNFSVKNFTLTANKSWLINLKETPSGAASTEKNLMKKTLTTVDTGSPLALRSISMYSCLNYQLTADPVNPGQFIYSNYVKRHYYYPNDELPFPMPPFDPSLSSQGYYVCHNQQQYGTNDSALYPRYELIPQQFTLWDRYDPRFVKVGEQLKINNLLQTRMINEYRAPADTKVNLFGFVKFASRPNVQIQGASQEAQITGYIMTPLLDSTGNATCPGQKELDSTDALYSLLKEYIGETEALYYAETEPMTISGQYIFDSMFIRETLLKKIRFYVENGMNIAADDTAAKTKQVFFYWPADTTYPLVKKSNQTLYMIRYSSSGFNFTDAPTSTVPRDKRIACIPKTSL